MPQGILTERDAVRLYHQGEVSLQLPLSQVMTRSLATITQDVLLHEAVERMHQERVRHLVVVDGSGRFQGVVSEQDVVAQLESEYLERTLADGRAAWGRLRVVEAQLHSVFHQASEYMAAAITRACPAFPPWMSAIALSTTRRSAALPWVKRATALPSMPPWRVWMRGPRLWSPPCALCSRRWWRGVRAGSAARLKASRRWAGRLRVTLGPFFHP